MLDTSHITIYTAAVWSSTATVPDDFIVSIGSVTMRPDDRNYTSVRLREGMHKRYEVFNFIHLEINVLVTYN